MFKWNYKFSKKEYKKVVIKNHEDWLVRNGNDEWISKNSLYNAVNVLYNNKWQLINRHPVKTFHTGLPDNADFVSWIWYSKLLWDYVCVKWTTAYKISSLWWTWSSIWTFSSIWSTDYTDIVDFYGLSTTADYTSTITSDANDRYVDDSAWTYAVWDLVWKYIYVSSQIRLITANTATRIFIDERFNSNPLSASSYSIYKKVPGLYLAWEWPQMKFWDWTTYWTWKPSWWYDAMRITKENNRLFLVDPTNKYRIKFSILWIGSEFPPLNYIDAEFEIKAIKNIKWQVIIYWESNRAKLIWDNPDNFEIINDSTHKWALSWWSVANWNNVQFFLSEEWVEQLNAIDNATNLEWVSISDKIKDLVLGSDSWGLDSTDFKKAKKRAHWSVSNWRYYLNIAWNVLIYDFENSTLLSKKLFTIWDYSEASQSTDTWYNIAWEWTCSKDIEWVLVFWQWWKLYYVQELNSYDDYGVTSTIESDKLNLGDNNRKKIIRRIKQNFANDWADTTYNIYISVDWWAYELVKTTTDNEIEVFIRKLAKTIRIKTVITQTAYSNIEHLRTEVYIEPKYIN